MATEMDLNNKGALFPHELFRLDNLGDTALSLNCLGFKGGDKGMVGINTSKFPDSDDGCGLVLGLGPTPSACFDGYGKGKGLMVSQGLASECDSVLKLGFSGVTKESVSALEGSVSGRNNNNNSVMMGQDDPVLIHVVDEGSTTAKKSGGYMPSLLLAPRMDLTSSLQTRQLLEFGPFGPNRPQVSSEVEISTSVETMSEHTTTVTSSSNPKKCKFAGCSKGARGASGLCIGHGGGQRCQKPGCNKGAESRTAYCKAHGGGRRCDHLGCTKSAEGKTDYCIAHGGGRRCSHSDGCTKAARGRSGLCIRHGGGKRCKVDGCTRSAEGQAGLCISHGGGRRCQYPECKKGAQGSTMYCKAHGGGKRCVFAGCTKGAEGSTPLCKGHGGGKRCLYDGGGICPKSVHGGTNFCVAHGGGKRCSIPGCTKSARGRTDCCVRHGGGKRCKQANCNKSAQGSTDFCKAHGGGKRCTWPEGKCEKFARGKSGLCASHSSMAQERETNRSGLIGPGLFRGLVSVASTSSGISAASDCTESLERPAKRRQHLIPPQVLVPLSMKASSSFLPYSRPDKPGKPDEGSSGYRSFDEMVPEGRVHGGGLMSLFGGNLKNAIDGI